MKNISRRKAIALSGTTLVGASVSAKGFVKTSEKQEVKKVLVFGAHPDDPETGCGGTIAILKKAGHEVVSVYLTRGEAGIPGKSHDEAAEIRTKEAKSACEILGVRAAFLGQIDGSCVVNNDEYERVYQFMQKEKPNVIFTHWPVDTHRDHRACSLLVYDAWLRMERQPAFFCHEVMTGTQTNNFYPTHYVDISGVIETKHEACYAHGSQLVDEWYDDSHGRMETYRGLEFGCAYAEAFVKHNQSKDFIFV